MKLPRITLRELFLLVVIAALGCGGWFQQGKISEARKERDEAEAKADEERSLAERIRKDQQQVIDAYHRDGRLHDVRRADGSVYVTDEAPPFAGGFGPAGK